MCVLFTIVFYPGPEVNDLRNFFLDTSISVGFLGTVFQVNNHGHKYVSMMMIIWLLMLTKYVRCIIEVMHVFEV